MPQPRRPLEDVLNIHHGGRITPAHWARIEAFLDEWEDKVLAAAKAHPARSYQLGRKQVEAFADLLGDLRGEVGAAGAFGGTSPSMREAHAWERAYTLNELQGALDKYVGAIKDALLYSLRGAINPTVAASLMYRATRDATINWRAIARTELVRANAQGRLAACKDMGFDRVWAPPHAGACKRCRQLLENKVFLISEVEGVTNFGRKNADEWIACIPLHPHCRHAWLPYDPDVYALMQEQYGAMGEAGLMDDDNLDEWFDSSGQLKPEYSNVDFSAAKTLEVAALSAAVWKATRDQPRPGRVERVDPDELRVDLYQRALDPDKVLSMRGRMLRHRKLGRPKVSLREDGTRYVYDGQHRVEAHKLAFPGQPIEVVTRQGMTWGDEHDACREAIAKIIDPLNTALADDMGDMVAKAASEASIDLTSAVVSPDALTTPGLDPLLFEGLRLRGEIRDHAEAAWARVAGVDWRGYSRLYLPADGRLTAVIDYPALRAARPDLKQLADTDIHLGLVLAARQRLQGDELAPGIPLDLRIAHEHTPAEYSEARDADEYGSVWALGTQQWLGRVPHGVEKTTDVAWSDEPVAKRIDAAAAAAWARGLNDDQVTELADWHRGGQIPAADTFGLALDARQRVWRGSTTDRPPFNGPLATSTDESKARGYAERGGRPYLLAIDLPAGTRIAYLPAIAKRIADRALDLTVNHEVLVANGQGELIEDGPRYRLDGVTVVPLALAPDGVAKQAAAANGGVEHWITVHPHGDDEKGQPVLVRNNSDGTMTVIGGAGGSLNYMRIDPKRRITSKESKARDKEAKAKDAAGLGGPEQTLTAQELQRQEAERKKTQREAQRTVDKADAKQKDLQEQLRQYIEQGVGAKWLTHGLIRHADGSTEEYELGFMERKQAMRKLIAGALQTLTLGEQDRKQEEASPYLFTEKHGDFEGLEEKADEDLDKPEVAEAEDPENPSEEPSEDAPEEPEQKKINQRLPQLDEDQANEVMRLEREIARWGRVKSKARGVLNAGKQASSAYAMDWTDSDVTEDVRKRVEAEVRTNAARELLDTSEENTFKVQYGTALRRGGQHTIDAFTHAVIGRAALNEDAVRLLGPVAAGQLIAHAIANRAAEVGDPEKLSVDSVRGALKDLVDQLEGETAGRATARARKDMETAVSMREERRASDRGESLWTKTAATSWQRAKFGDAAQQLGMAIGGFQAASALQTALEKPPKNIEIHGGRDAAALRERCKEAGIEVTPDMVTKTSGGNYVAQVPMEACSKLFNFQQTPDHAHKARLNAIRTGKGLGREIERNRVTPGMKDRLVPEQAQGKMFLLESGQPGTNRQWNLTGTPIEKKAEDLRAQLSLGDVLDFAPGVGKTHTAIAAAMQLMHDEPEKNHRVLVVAPNTALGGWLGTALKQNPDLTAQVMGKQHTEIDREKGKVEMRPGGGKAARQAQLDSPCHFNIISHDQLKKNPNIGADLGCTIIVNDEAQKHKNEKNQRSDALRTAGEAIGAERPKMPSRTAWGEATDKLDRGHEHVMREDKVREFRERYLDGHLFHMDAAQPGKGAPESGVGLPARDKGNANLFDGQPDESGYQHHEVTLDPEHRAVMQKVVSNINHMAEEAKATGNAGPAFGGALIMQKALLDRPGNAFAKTAAKVMADRLQGTVDFKGWKDHPNHPDGADAGKYAKKGVIFNQGVQELKHLVPELEAQGVKVFATVRPKKGDENGLWESVDDEGNEQVQKDYLAHNGPCVLVTTDKNSTARSWQFGDNNGNFQHGGTEFMHYSLPDQGGNATIKQREARIHRRGAVAPVAYHKLQAPEIPSDMRQNDRLMRELKVQQLAGNSTQLVGGKQTLRHRLNDRGVAPANELDAAAPDQPEEEHEHAPA